MEMGRGVIARSRERPRRSSLQNSRRTLAPSGVLRCARNDDPLRFDPSLPATNRGQTKFEIDRGLAPIFLDVFRAFMPWQVIIDVEPWNRLSMKNMLGRWEVFRVIKCANVNR